MTLQEAYKKLKEELRTVKKENDQLKKGTYCPEEKLLLEAEIRKLRAENKKYAKDCEEYHCLWQKAVKQNESLSRAQFDYEYKRLNERILFLDAERMTLMNRLVDLGKETASLKAENQRLRTELEEALDRIAKLKAQMNRDYENSSIPSSQKPFHKKIKNSREKTDRKPGAQPGHHGHPRPHLEPTVPVITLPVPTEIADDPDLYPTDEFITKQVADIDISVSVTEYRAQVFRSRTTGRRVHAVFPNGVVNEFNYGSHVKSLAFLLNNYCNVSIDKTTELISSVTGGKIILSKGLINSLSDAFSSATEKERKRIFSNLQLAPAMHSDATPGRVNGKSVQIILCANENEMLYFCKDHKGHEGLKDTPIENYQQTIIHDHDVTYYNHGSSHQECLAHVLRYLQDGIDNEPDLTWHTKMKVFLSSVIHEAKQSRDFTPERIKRIHSEYDEILKIGESEYMDHPPNKYYPDGFNLYKRMLKYKDSHLYFLDHSEVEYTNNLAERSLRKFKRKQKQAVTFRSKGNVKALCDSLSIIETAKLQGISVYKTVLKAFT